MQEVSPKLNKLTSEKYDKLTELQFSPINDKEKNFNKNEPFGDLSGIIKRNILSQNKRQKKIKKEINKEMNILYQSNANINVNNYIMTNNFR